MRALACAVQGYEWGVRGEASAVARLGAAGGSVPILDVSAPYAELWCGTHASGPSRLRDGEDEGQLLLEYLDADRGVRLGAQVVARFGAESADLPFLFKVLSVAKALSIQAHPDKALASKLHADRPDVYKDANHKPEMALALTRFEALCGFLPAAALATFLGTVPELRAVVGEAAASAFVAACAASGGEADQSAARAQLKAVFSTLMTADAALVKAQLDALVARASAAGPAALPEEKLALRLHAQYPGDVGVFCAFVLNHLELSPGQGIFLAANEPHAYLDGDCVECMATSDNVVRAGLTPKLRDTSVLCDMLTYDQGPPRVLTGEPLDAYIRRYSPPVDEFEVDLVAVPPGASCALATSPGAQIAIVTAGRAAVQTPAPGQAEEIRTGEVHLVHAHERVALVAGPEGATLYVAGVSRRRVFGAAAVEATGNPAVV